MATSVTPRCEHCGGLLDGIDWKAVATRNSRAVDLLYQALDTIASDEGFDLADAPRVAREALRSVS